LIGVAGPFGALELDRRGCIPKIKGVIGFLGVYGKNMRGLMVW
jgi:hypothetical protein